MSNQLVNDPSHHLVKNVDFTELLNHWDIEYESNRSDINIHGSPERTTYRIVIQDKKKSLYVLEMFLKERYRHKKLISDSLDLLNKNGIFFIQPFLRSITDDSIIEFNDRYWQIIPYIDGIDLDRPRYIFDSWRGIKSAEFLIDLWKKTKGLSFLKEMGIFSLKSFVLEMIEIMKRFNKRQYKQLGSVISFLKEDFFKEYDSISQCFSHGDFHQLNIIWSNDSILSVIDWEFLGFKPEIYDIANLLGCIGIEEPTGLIQEYAVSFINKVKTSNMISDISFHYLLDCIISLRFGWLSEWFRKKDNDMINLEIDYMNLLLKNRDVIKSKWNSN